MERSLLRNSISFLFRYLGVQSNYPLTFPDIIEPRRLESPASSSLLTVASGWDSLLGHAEYEVAERSLPGFSLSLSLWTESSLIAFVRAPLRSFLDSFAPSSPVRQVCNHLGKTRDLSVSPGNVSRNCSRRLGSFFIEQFQENQSRMYLSSRLRSVYSIVFGQSLGD